MSIEQVLLIFNYNATVVQVEIYFLSHAGQFEVTDERAREIKGQFNVTFTKGG